MTPVLETSRAELRASTVALLALISLMSGALGQRPPTVLIRASIPDPTGTPGYTVLRVRGLETNRCGGYAVWLRTVGPQGGIGSLLFGTYDGDAPRVLRAPAVVGAFTQLAIWDDFALADDAIVYVASGRSTPSAPTQIGIWREDALVALDGAPSHLPGDYFTNVEQVDVTALGEPFFRGRTLPVSAPLGPEYYGLYRGFLPTPPYQFFTLTPVPGFDAPFTMATYQASRFGSRTIARGRCVEFAWPDREALALDGAAYLLEGVRVGTGELVPAAAGGNGERWSHIYDARVDEHGHVTVVAETDSYPDGHVLLVDGRIRYRERDVVAGIRLREQGFGDWPQASPFRAVRLSDTGELGAVVYASGVTFTGRYLVVDDEIVLQRGDVVDVDGDGVPDPGYTIYSIADGADSFAFASNGDLLVRAYVENGPVGWEALLRIPRTIGVEYCPATANSSGVSARISVVGSERVTDDDVRLRCTGVAPLRRGIFLASRQPGYIAHPGGSPGNLCIGAPFVRLGSGALDSGAEGVFELPLMLNQVPNPSGGVGVTAGESWYFTTWFRDFAGSVFSSQFSSAIRVTFR